MYVELVISMYNCNNNNNNYYVFYLIFANFCIVFMNLSYFDFKLIKL